MVAASSGNIQIRLAAREDLPGIDAIYNQAIAMKMATADLQPYSKEERQLWFEAHPEDLYPVYVVTINSKVIAYLSLSAYRPRREALKYAVEISYFIDKSHRGQGIGSLMMQFGLQLAGELGHRYVIAILMGHNDASIGLLKKFGFSEWGRLPGIAHYDNNRYDHLLYGREV